MSAPDWFPTTDGRRSLLAGACLAVILGSLIVIAFAVGGMRDGGNAPTIPRPIAATATRPGLHEVVYDVRGSASSVSLTTVNATGGTEQLEAGVPWTRTLEVPDGSFLYISAQNDGASGNVICIITVNGTIVQQATSDADYGIAGCSARV